MIRRVEAPGFRDAELCAVVDGHRPSRDRALWAEQRGDGPPSTTAGTQGLLVQIHVPEPGAIVLLAIGITALAGAAAN